MQISLTAAHCAKTLVVASTTGNLWLRQCAKTLFPGLIEYIAKMAPLVHDGTITESQTTGVGEVWKAFSAFFNSVGEEHRESISSFFADAEIDLSTLGARMLGILLPTISLLLSNQTSAVSTQTVGQLLSYATSSPEAFKEAAAKLDVSTKELLEQSIRRAMGSSSSGAAQAVKPQISLRSF